MDYYYYDQDYVAEQDDYESHNFDEYVDESTFNSEEVQTITESLETCIKPSAKQITGYICLIVGWSLLFRLLCLVSKHKATRNDWLKHMIATICGFATLYCTIGTDMLIIVFLSVFGYTLMLVLEYRKIKQLGIIVAATTIGLHFVYELFWNVPESWQRLRGIQMIATMKIISLAFDLEEIGNKKQLAPVPGLIPYLGYIFCPATCVLGPWVPYNAYLQSLQPNGAHLRWIVWTVFNILIAILFLCLSNCIAPLVCTDHAWKWIVTYRDALAVRASHYFICFLSQAAITAGNINFNTNESPNIAFGPMITKPWHIEFPRSLNHLVRNWNVPMHNWLKTYVFRTTHKQTKNYFFAILYTYLVSSLLHGLHYRIYLVLISLALFAYLESVLRLKLSCIFNACLMPNPCRSVCPYKNCTSHGLTMNALIVVLVNFLFRLLCCMHLAYLGIMMNTSGVENEEISLRTGLQRWSQLDYISHWILAGTYLFYRII